MHLRTGGSLLAGLIGTALSLACARAELPHVPPPLPAVAGRDAPGLPPIPSVSPRNASYSIDARLDPVKRTIAGTLVLEWRNTSDQELSSFPFHLYWNAFRNDLSTSARGEGRRTPGEREREERSYGWIEVKSVRLVGEAEVTIQDLTPTLLYLHPDGNVDDRTVFEVRSAGPVAPGGTARFRVEWEALVPHGSVGRAGWVHDYHFIAQWFPKIGVFWKGRWNAHPFYPWTEFFSDFGVYDVRLTLPKAFVVGATGRLRESTDNPDGTRTLRFVQEDVHDFAWTASQRFLEHRARFEDPGYPPVDIRLLLQPEHAHLAERYLAATKIALRTYGTWSAPYPYAQVTVVDPAYGSASGGMEYPTLFTGGASVLAPPELQSPEGVTIHEAGHQFWYGLVASNEFEEAWLDEGFNTYMTSKATDHSLGPEGWGRRYFGAGPGLGGRVGWPVVAPGVRIPRGSDQPRRPARGRRGRRHGEEGLDLPGRGLLRPQLLRQARPRDADPGGPARRGDDGEGAPHLGAAAPVRPPDDRGLHRHRQRGHGPGLAVVLRPDLLHRQPVRLRGRGDERAGAPPRGLVRGEGRDARAAEPGRREGRTKASGDSSRGSRSSATARSSCRSSSASSSPTGAW